MSEILARQIAFVEQEVTYYNKAFYDPDKLEIMKGILASLKFLRDNESLIRSAVKLARDETREISAAFEIDTAGITMRRTS